jgi:4-hydroxybenzoate polyprenyltransferase
MSAVAARANDPLHVLASVSRLHIVAIAALQTLTFGWLFTGSYLWLLAGVSALDWLLVNVLNRVVDLPEDRTNDVVGTNFVARHATLIRAAAFTVLFASIALVHRVIPAVTIVRLAFHGLGLIYNWPLLPARVRLKQLYVLKNVAPAIGFLLTCVGYPLAGAGGQLASGVGVGTIVTTSLFLFLFELSYEVIYDLRDTPGDRAALVFSFPVIHGERSAALIVDGLCVAAVVTLVLGFALRLVPWRIAVMAIAPLLQIYFYKRWVSRGVKALGVRLTWLGVGLLVAYHLWIVLGLPGVAGPAG